MTDFQRRSWVAVDLDALEENVSVIRKRVNPESMIMAVVKADAYGHGDRCIALTLEEQGKVDWFGVSRLEEALALRDYGVTLPILVFGITPVHCVDMLLDFNIVPTVHSLDYAKELSSAVSLRGKEIPIHIKIDTGMSRMGFQVYGEYLQPSLESIETIYHLDNLIPQGLYTHFACSDTINPCDKEYTREQFQNYTNARDLLALKGVRFPICHCSNSAAIVHYPEMNLDMVRAGIVLYGLYPDPDCEPYIPLIPIMNFYATVVAVKEIPAGRTVSYGRDYMAFEPTTIANVGIGYADGYDRVFSDCGEMILKGKRVPVVGRVCMDQLMLDVSEVEGVKAGDLVTVVGTDGAETISFEDLARETNTIHYEKTSVIGKRVPRVYYKKQQVIDVTDLLRGRSSGFEGKSLCDSTNTDPSK